MNFLAHSLVARDQSDLVVGAFLGDEIRGSRPQWEPLWFARGIALHRFVDTYADEHPAFAASRQRFDPPYRRFAGILVDLAYDHLLANRFAEYHKQTLRQFNDDTAAHLIKGTDQFSIRMRAVCRAIADDRLLASYATEAGMRRVLVAISRRLSRPNPLVHAWQPITECLDGIALDFEQFMPDLWLATSDWLASDPLGRSEQRPPPQA
ncbi:MAG: ACP phosphodiesterase [Lysobacteraceae bacterium]|nr:MAG: ACP phosphodiesterase [Xanthomonadaceae bacterium]